MIDASSRRWALDERGSATPLALLLMALIGLFGVTGAVLLAHWGAYERAGHVADLAALAAAKEQAIGGAPCPVAAAVAARNGARLTQCRRQGAVIEVGAEVAVRIGFPGVPAVEAATARAAPVT